MKLSVIFEDGVILIDRQAKFGFEFPDADPNWRVIQWNGVKQEGWIEVHHGDRIWLDDPTVVQTFIDMYNANQPAPLPSD